MTSQRFPRAFTDLVGCRYPIVQAPMAGANDWKLAAAVSAAGGLGFLPCGMLKPAEVESEVERIRDVTDAPFGLNFFCHQRPNVDDAVINDWIDRLRPYFDEYGIDPDSVSVEDSRAPFDEAMCEMVTSLRPKVVSFHYGLPNVDLLGAVKRAGCIVLSSATTVEEAVALEERGVDVIIAQGLEAGGHRGAFLEDSLERQMGLFALLPQVVDAVGVPVVATGGIADRRGVEAAFALGACAVQLGTAFLRCPEAVISPMFRAALEQAKSGGTQLTNVLTGGLARGLPNRAVKELGPISDVVPPFPFASAVIKPLRTAAEQRGRSDFTPLWAGQAVARRRALREAGELIAQLAGERHGSESREG